MWYCEKSEVNVPASDTATFPPELIALSEIDPSVQPLCGDSYCPDGEYCMMFPREHCTPLGGINTLCSPWTTVKGKVPYYGACQPGLHCNASTFTCEENQVFTASIAEASASSFVTYSWDDGVFAVKE